MNKPDFQDVKDQLKSAFVQEPTTMFHYQWPQNSTLVHACFDFSVGLCVGVGDNITQASKATLQQTSRKQKKNQLSTTEHLIGTEIEILKDALKFLALSIWHSQYYHASVFYSNFCWYAMFSVY